MSESENFHKSHPDRHLRYDERKEADVESKRPEGESFSDFSGNPRKCQLCIGIINTIGHHACIPDSRAEWQ